MYIKESSARCASFSGVGAWHPRLEITDGSCFVFAIAASALAGRIFSARTASVRAEPIAKLERLSL